MLLCLAVPNMCLYLFGVTGDLQHVVNILPGLVVVAHEPEEEAGIVQGGVAGRPAHFLQAALQLLNCFYICIEERRRRRGRSRRRGRRPREDRMFSSDAVYPFCTSAAAHLRGNCVHPGALLSGRPHPHPHPMSTRVSRRWTNPEFLTEAHSPS